MYRGGRYADGDHIHGGSGGPDFFNSGGLAGGRVDFWAGVPAVLCSAIGPAGGPANGIGEDWTKALSAKGNYDVGVEIFTDYGRPGNDSPGRMHSHLRSISRNALPARAGGAVWGRDGGSGNAAVEDIAGAGFAGLGTAAGCLQHRRRAQRNGGCAGQ